MVHVAAWQPGSPRRRRWVHWPTVSPDARVAAAAIITEPALVLDELLALAGHDGADGDGLQQMAGELGVDLRADIAATLGGEVTIALDGPLVPNPAWK